MKIEIKLPQHEPIVVDEEVLRPFEKARDDAPAATPCRLAFAAARVVMRDEYADQEHSIEAPGDPEAISEFIDWDVTLRQRQQLDELGFGVAEAMDTAQRFFIGWTGAERLIRECGALGLKQPWIAGAGADHLPKIRNQAALVNGVLHQIRKIQEQGGLPIVLPLVWLARQGSGARRYVEVYGEIIRKAEGPLFIHWLGGAFHPELGSYFPGDSFDRVMALDPEKVRGCKLSILDPARELKIRRELLPRDQIVLTGDDLDFTNLILGDSPTSENAPTGTTRIGGVEVPLGDYSHAMLGILDGIAEPAALALQLLAAGDVERYVAVMRPCEALSRHIFKSPVTHYKAGLAFLAWLNGRQTNAMLANHEERARTTNHYLELARLAADAGVLSDVPRAAELLERFATS